VSNPQLAEIDASLQAIVRRAYDLGRDDVLKKVVESLKADQPGSEQLALMAPDKAAHQAEAARKAEATASTAPWWAWPVR
jgi:hypothetical protein